MNDGRPVKRAFPAEHWTDVVVRCQEDIAQARQETVKATEAAAASAKEAAAAKRDAADKINKAAQTVENLSQQNRSLAARIRELEGPRSGTQVEVLHDISGEMLHSLMTDSDGAYYETAHEGRPLATMQLEAMRWASALIGLEKILSEVLEQYNKVRSAKLGVGFCITDSPGYANERDLLARKLEDLRTIMQSTSHDSRVASAGHNEFLKGSISRLPLNTPDRLRMFLNKRHLEVIKTEWLI